MLIKVYIIPLVLLIFAHISLSNLYYLETFFVHISFQTKSKAMLTSFHKTLNLVLKVTFKSWILVWMNTNSLTPWLLIKYTRREDWVFPEHGMVVLCIRQFPLCLFWRLLKPTRLKLILLGPIRLYISEWNYYTHP